MDYASQIHVSLVYIEECFRDLLPIRAHLRHRGRPVELHDLGRFAHFLRGALTRGVR